MSNFKKVTAQEFLTFIKNYKYAYLMYPDFTEYYIDGEPVCIVTEHFDIDAMKTETCYYIDNNFLTKMLAEKTLEKSSLSIEEV